MMLPLNWAWQRQTIGVHIIALSRTLILLVPPHLQLSYLLPYFGSSNILLDVAIGQFRNVLDV